MDLNFNRNEDHNKLLLSALKKKFLKASLGGGKSRIEKLHKQGKMTARERVDFLLDTPKKAIEIATLAADDMYSDHGGCPAAGVVVKVGHIQSKLCVIVANDKSRCMVSDDCKKEP